MKTNQKKAQMKIQQMSFMIIAVFLFLAMVGMMVVTLRLNQLREDATKLQEENAMLLASKIANSPEFSCGDAYSGESDCIDLDKVMMLKSNIVKYTWKGSNFWGITNIEIRRIYPETIISSSQIDCTYSNDPRCTIECTYSNYPKCNYIKLVGGQDAAKGIGKSNYVALCRKENYNGETVDKCEMGEIIIKYEAYT
ncbi:MAG: hypothetical protein ACP5NZ_05285 [Nanobdellota archaeon]